MTAPTGSSTSFTLTDFVEALHTVALPYRNQNGAWIVADGVLKSLRKAVRATGTGDPFFVDPDTPDEPPMLLGYPIFTNMPAPAANAKSVMFAGWERAYVIRRVIGLETKRLDEAYAANGQVGRHGLCGACSYARNRPPQQRLSLLERIAVWAFRLEQA